jgi:hypothetical protein
VLYRRKKVGGFQSELHSNAKLEMVLHRAEMKGVGGKSTEEDRKQADARRRRLAQGQENARR